MIEKRNELDIIIMCGSPAAGKSSFVWKHLAPMDYERVNQDLLGTVSDIYLGWLISSLTICASGKSASKQQPNIWLTNDLSLSVQSPTVTSTVEFAFTKHFR